MTTEMAVRTGNDRYDWFVDVNNLRAKTIDSSSYGVR